MQVKALLALCLSGCAMSAGAAPTATPNAAPVAEAEPAAVPVAAAEPPAAEPAAEAGPIAERVAVPGGRLSRDARTCDAASDHCLRPETWFLVKTLGKMRTLEAVFWAEGAWRDWSSGVAVEGRPAHRTKPAAFEDLAVGGQVIFRNERGASNESEAHGSWRLETVHSIDNEKKTFKWGNGTRGPAIEHVRAIVESRE